MTECVRCGAPVMSPSVGGPGICNLCDCLYPKGEASEELVKEVRGGFLGGGHER